jgi:hypothetical protein
MTGRVLISLSKRCRQMEMGSGAVPSHHSGERASRVPTKRRLSGGGTGYGEP